MPATSELLSFASGIFAGLVTNAIWDQRRRLRRHMAKLLGTRSDIIGFDSSQMGLYPINRWSLNRPLERHQLIMRITSERPEQRWLDASAWNQIAQDLSNDFDGETAYLIDFSIDHRESKKGAAFQYTVTPCRYNEHLATVQYLAENTDSIKRIENTLASGEILRFAQSAPPSLIKINVALLERDNYFLGIKRSGAVVAKKGVWTVGPNETMKFPDQVVPGDAVENLFGLAERCLREEIGLEATDYGDINISWIGYDVTTAAVKVFAQTTTHLSAQQVEEYMASAHGIFEAQEVAWLPLNRRTLTDIIRNWNHGDSSGRIWSSSAPLALHEMWRNRRLLHSEPW
jgi:hypothetical protein